MESEVRPRKPYPSDVSDEEWAFVAPYLTLMTPDAPQRRHDLREVFNAMRWIVRSGAPWRYLPTNFPPWEAVYQQTRRWIDAGVFAEMTHDLRELLRWSEGRDPDPSAVIFDSTTRQSTPESGARAGYDGDKRKQGQQGPYRRRYPGAPAGAARDPGERPGAGAGRGPGRGGAGGDGADGRGGLRRSGLHRPGRP